MYLGWQCPHFLGREGLAARLRPSYPSIGHLQYYHVIKLIMYSDIPGHWVEMHIHQASFHIHTNTSLIYVDVSADSCSLTTLPIIPLN